MKKKAFIQFIFTSAIIAISTFSVISCSNEHVQIDEDEVGLWDVSRPMGYKSFDELFTDKDMDLIAVGVIDRVIQVTELKESERVDTYQTAFAFRIETLYMGEDVKEIVVNQLGSPDVPTSACTDDPIFKVGERHLLFLKKNIHGTYYSIGPAGRYKIVNNKVYSLNYVLPDDRHYKAPETMDFNGIDLSTFSKAVINRLDKK